jgi:hypothetical protein
LHCADQVDVLVHVVLPLTVEHDEPDDEAITTDEEAFKCEELKNDELGCGDVGKTRRAASASRSKSLKRSLNKTGKLTSSIKFVSNDKVIHTAQQRIIQQQCKQCAFAKLMRSITHGLMVLTLLT